MWDYLRKEYVDPRTSPNVVEFQIDSLTGFKYNFIDTLSKSKKNSSICQGEQEDPTDPSFR